MANFMRGWSGLEVLAEGEKSAVLFQDGVQGDDGGVHLVGDGCEGGGFQDHFERLWAGAGRGSQHTDVALTDDAVAGGKVVDPATAVAGKDAGGGAECGGEDVDRMSATESEAVEAVAGVVGMKGKVTFEIQLADFVLKKTDLELFRGAPELPIQVEAGAVVAGAVGVTGGIADRIKKNLVAPGQFRPGDKVAQKTDGRHGAGDLVPMDAGKDTEALIRVATLRAKKAESGEVMGIRQVITVNELVGTEIAMLSKEIFERGEEILQAWPVRE